MPLEPFEAQMPLFCVSCPLGLHLALYHHSTAATDRVVHITLNTHVPGFQFLQVGHLELLTCVIVCVGGGIRASSYTASCERQTVLRCYSCTVVSGRVSAVVL